MAQLRERKKAATRLAISNIATELFTERGFDAVTVDEVAAAANVSKMTVFNYFARKEDLLFDRNDEVIALLRARIAARGSQAPIPALRAFVHELVEQHHPLVRMGPRVSSFWKTVADSATLRAHTRRIAAELERELAAMLVETAGEKPGEPVAQLVATLLVGTWRVAFREAMRRPRAAQLFLELMDRGFAAAMAAARGTAYTKS
jgi:AcrR family transcriptional regulator